MCPSLVPAVRAFDGVGAGGPEVQGGGGHLLQQFAVPAPLVGGQVMVMGERWWGDTFCRGRGSDGGNTGAAAATTAGLLQHGGGHRGKCDLK